MVGGSGLERLKTGIKSAIPTEIVSLKQALAMLFGGIDTADKRRRRLLGIVQGAITSLGNRMIAMFVSFLSVPLTIGYLGAERYGAWIALGSLLAWLTLSDFGLSNGLTNAVNTAAAENRPDLVRTHLSNALVLFSFFGCCVVFVAILCGPYIDWANLLGLTTKDGREEIGLAGSMALGIFVMQLPLSVTGKLYLAYQEGRIGNYWGIAGNILSLIALIIVTHTHGGLPALVIAVSGTSLLVNASSGIWMFACHRPELRPTMRSVDWRKMGQLLNVGSRFFVMQILSLFMLQTDNIVIGHFLGANQIPQYSLTYTLFSYTSLAQSIIFPYLWAAYTEAIAKRDIAWVRRTFRLNLWLGLAFTGVAATGLVLIARPFINWWAQGVSTPSWSLVVWMAAWSIISAFTSPIACLLAAASHLKLQVWCSLATTLLNVGLTLALVKTWGIDGVIAGTVISTGVFSCLPIYADALRLLRRLSSAAEDPEGRQLRIAA